MAKETYSMISGTGHYLPETILSNKDLEKIVDTSDEWITQRVGIKERHIVGDQDLCTSDLAYEASKRALEDANLTAEDLDLIIVATVTPDMKFPSTAIFLQQKLGAKKAAAFDLSAACSGFLYSLNIANSFIKTGKYQHILIVGVEILTSMINWKDRSTAVIFGDGAGACILSPSDGTRGVMGTYMKSDGNLANLLYAKGGGTKEEKKIEFIKKNQDLTPEQEFSDEDKRMYIRMEGHKVYKYAVKSMIEAANKAMEDAEMEYEEIDLFIPHQANTRIIEAIGKRVKIDNEKIFVNLPYTGNTSAASIPIALDQARKEGKLKENDNLLVSAFGGGFTWAGAVIKL